MTSSRTIQASPPLELEYPLYACDFDPRDSSGTRLVVAGGGGPGRSGVPNRITALEIPSSASDSESVPPRVTAVADLSRDEDSVMSLAVGAGISAPRKPDRSGLVVYAGVNSSPADVSRGENKHFRVFHVEAPGRGRTGSQTASTSPGGKKAEGSVEGKMAEAARTQMFTSKDPGAYQRILRLSPPFEAATSAVQVGAAATGLAKDAQMAIFEVGTQDGGSGIPKLRGTLELRREAVDLDVIQVNDDKWQLAYCDEYAIHIMEIAGSGKVKSESGPANVYTIPTEDVATGFKARPQFRSLRWLTDNFVLATLNVPQSRGVLIQAFRISKPTAKEDQGQHPKARLALSERAPRHLLRSLSLAVRNLSPPPTPSARQLEAQFIIAIAGHDQSITLFTLEHRVAVTVNQVTDLRHLTTLRNVHPGPIGGLALSYFATPKTPTMRVHHVRLASIGSVGKTVVVHSLPLKKRIEPSASRRSAGPARPARYVSAITGRGASSTPVLITLTIMVLLLSFVAQSFLELKGFTNPVLGAHRFVPASWQDDWRSPATTSHEVFIQGKDGVQLVEQHAGARRWDDLRAEEQSIWRERLRKAGHWSEEMGETVLKKMLFGEMAGLVGAAINGVVREL